MKLYAFATTRAFWDQPAVATAVEQAHDAARRLVKSVDAGRERRRLATALRAIDEAARSAYPAPRLLEGEDAETMVAALPRIGTTRLPFRTLDRPGGVGGFIIMPVPFDPASCFRPPTAVAPAAAQGGAAADRVDPAPEPRGRDRLARAIAAARTDGRAVSLGRARHPEITTAMRRYLHQEGEAEGFEIRFVYLDGSLSGPVVLGALAERPRPAAEDCLTVGLNSCRHFSLDLKVDFYLLRNAEFERREGGSFADQERLAHARMEALLRNYRDGSLDLTLHHTGLEPAVVGAYRAIIDALLDGQRLAVTPIFHPGAPAQGAWW